MSVPRTLKEIGAFPVVGDAIDVRHRWEPHPRFATAAITDTDATHVEVEWQLTISSTEPFRYRIPRTAWVEMCAAPNQLEGSTS